ncbi:globin [Plakobranchus ocellatus]|uniref:Globin n=1 Tax=Plakobranchus ocellatus TaxID=259542 RepID=A0AAV4B210_9GAST|nr:globin [Plakobranchus ocellatus]
MDATYTSATDQLDAIMGMSAHDRQLVKDSVDVMFNEMQIENKSVKFLIAFFKRHPHHQRYFKLFRDVSLDELLTLPVLGNHGRKVMEQMKKLVQNIEDLKLIQDHLSWISMKHRPRKVRSRQFKDMLSMFVEFTSQEMGDRFTEEHELAWKRWLGYILKVLENEEGKISALVGRKISDLGLQARKSDRAKSHGLNAHEMNNMSMVIGRSNSIETSLGGIQVTPENLDSPKVLNKTENTHGATSVDTSIPRNNPTIRDLSTNTDSEANSDTVLAESIYYKVNAEDKETSRLQNESCTPTTSDVQSYVEVEAEMEVKSKGAVGKVNISSPSEPDRVEEITPGEAKGDMLKVVSNTKGSISMSAPLEEDALIVRI